MEKEEEQKQEEQEEQEQEQQQQKEEEEEGQGDGKWACTSCTFENTEDSRRCKMCDKWRRSSGLTKRQYSAVVPSPLQQRPDVTGSSVGAYLRSILPTHTSFNSPVYLPITTHSQCTSHILTMHALCTHYATNTA